MLGKILSNVRNILFFADIDHLSYSRITPKICRTNRVLITVFSGVAAALLTSFYFVTYYVEATRVNRPVYELGAAFSIGLFICAKFLAKRFDRITTSLVHIAVASFYVYGILIGTVIGRDHTAVTFMVLLVFMPVLFIDRPLHTILTSFFYTAIFIILSHLLKPSYIVPMDTVNAVTFSILGAISGTIINHMKLRGYVVEKMLHEISRNDKLTQMNNRNAYELDHDMIPRDARRMLGCVYIDVNDLKRINDTYGHERGDEMLKYVAAQIMNYFGKQYSYRVGGDEFIAFIHDPGELEIIEKVRGLVRSVEKAGYHIAVGSSTDKARNIDIDKLVTNAEVIMYREKKYYHEKHDHKHKHNK